GQDILEVGPGPGLTTDLLRPRLERLTALEIDSRLAGSLGRRLQGSNVRVIQGDATAMPFGSKSFSGAISLTMLHHVPSPAMQDKLLSEVCRVLKPGAMFAGIDSLWSRTMQILHIWDTLVPIDPSTFRNRLEAAGFVGVSVDVEEGRFRFRARRPEAASV
ncbi:MAG: class I SAM-dependent methyltransferase, partial [Terriglobia bacterium]